LLSITLRYNQPSNHLISYSMKRIELFLEALIFNSRWLLAPFYLCLVGSIVLLLIKFLGAFAEAVHGVFVMTESELILSILTLVDLSLVANLLLIIIFSGYENFVSKIDTANHKDRPEWMGKVDFSGLKIKLIASIVAISAIELLKAFVNIDSHSQSELAWKVGIHMVLIVSGVLFAVMDRIADGTAHGVEDRKHSDSEKDA
jgi:uncharacterized protein (TIGR00645 family)